MRTLISFLGRVPRDENNQYRRTEYRFPDGATCEPAAFFGYALAGRLRPDRLVILGTPGSMWDHLFEGDLPLGNVAEDWRQELLQSVEDEVVNQSQLDDLAPVLAQHLQVDVSLRLIPYCFDEMEQIQLLKILAEEVGDQARLDLDVTHGFRHLPMLALLAAIYLRNVRNVTIEGIWYAAFNPDTGDGPVMRLDGLMRIHEWVDAMIRFDSNGNYGVFAPLLKREGLPQDMAACLGRAHHHEQTLNIPMAANNLGSVRGALGQPLNGPAELFRSQLRDRLAWAEPRHDLAKQQYLLSCQALERGDFLRASIFGFEAFITRQCLKGGREARDYEQRDEVRRQFEASLTNNEHPKKLEDAYRTLRNLRNSMAHGTPPVESGITTLLRDPTELPRVLRSALNELHSSP